MDPSRFDGLARGIAGFTSRRTTLAGLLGGLAVPLLGEAESEARTQRHKRRREHEHNAHQKQDHAGHGLDAEKKKKKKKKKCKSPTTKCGKTCFNLQTDRANCGACGKACAAGESCQGGACTCDGARCAGCCAGGVCQGGTSDLQCGAGGGACAACPSGTSCKSGVCACGGGGACDAGETCCAGVCVDRQTDAGNCGQCGDTCRAGETCAVGNCVCGSDTCAGNETCCGDACVDTDIDLANCGVCGNDCGFGQGCSEGVCVCGISPACTAGEICCSTGCAHLATDVNNCGQCDHACGANEQCCGGQCVNTTTVDNCGACGSVCPGYMQPNDNVTCQNGNTCAFSCQGDHYDVDGNPANGCEASYTGGSHTKETAFGLGSKSCDKNTVTTTARAIYSDTRVHTNPAVSGFNVATGAAPQWLVVQALGGGSPFPSCVNTLDVTLTMSSGTGSCYKLTVQTNQDTWSELTNASGIAHIVQGVGSYADNTPVYFMVEKTCSTSVHEAATYTITYHL